MAGGKLQLVARATNPRATGYGGYKKRKYPKRVYKRSVNKFDQLVICKRPVCPGRLLIPLKLTPTIQTLTCTAGASNQLTWRANNIYSPINGTTNTPQPMGQDQWFVFYNNYRVLSSNIKVEARNVTDAQPIRLGLNTTGTTSGGASADSVSEGRAKIRFGGDDGKLVHNQMFRKIHNMFQISKSQYEGYQYVSSTGNKPTNTAMWQIWVQPFDESTTVNIEIKVTITYYVYYTNPKFVAQS